MKDAYEIINKSPLAVFLWENDRGLPVEFVSENVEKIFGYDSHEFTSGMINYIETIHPEDIERAMEESALLSPRCGNRD